MNHPLTRRLGATILGLGLAVTSAGLASAPAHAAPAKASAKAGDTSLAEVLGADGQKLDKNWQDFDLVEAAVFAVLDAKPTSPVGLLADGDTRLTAFVPTDAAFRDFVRGIKGFAPKTEEKTLKQVVKIAGSIDTIETILLYHVIAGKTLTSPKVLAAEGDKLTTAQGGTFRVRINKVGVALVDKDPDAHNPFVVVLDVNRGNKQIAHGISRVLRPVDL
jgi:hypothetical protein